MRNFCPQILARLEENCLVGVDAGPEAIYPHYSGYSLTNLPSSICRWLGVPEFGGPSFGEELINGWNRSFRRVILLLVDGLGLNTLLQAIDLARQDPDYAVWGRLAQAEETLLAPLTSVVPSTTSAALTTLWTGRTPAEHGVVGYEVWLKEFSLIANMILQSPASFTGDMGGLRKAGFEPATFLPVPTLGPHLARYGVRSYAFQHQTIAHSGLSTMLQPGVTSISFRSLSDLWVTLDGLLDRDREAPGYYYVYWGDLDEHSHRFGPQDRRVALELAQFSRQLSAFLTARQPRRQPDTLLIIAADHGHITTPRQPEYELRNHPGLLNCLTMIPSGEARLPFVFLRNGQETRFVDYVHQTWPGQFRLLPSEAAIRGGLFGPNPGYARLPDRVGDYVVVPQGSAYWWFADRDNLLHGRHGGLSRTEMLIPFLGVPI